MSESLRYFAFVAATLFFASAPSAIAHPTQFTVLQVKVEHDGSFKALLNIDILSYALDKTSLDATNEELETLLEAPRSMLDRRLKDAGQHFRGEVVIRTDAGNATISTWTLPGLADVDAVLARRINPRILMPGEIEFSGVLPSRARTLAIRLPYVLGDTVQLLELPGGASHEEPVAAGNYSSTAEVPFAPSALTEKTIGDDGLAAARQIGPEFRFLAPVVGLVVVVLLWLRIFSRNSDLRRELDSRILWFDTKRRIVFMYAFLGAANIAAWIWALIAFHTHPVLLGTASLAYTFGLRHAVDADHIAAIDNVTRKLMHQGKHPVGVGLFFSLGHSTVVFGLSVVIAVTSVALKGRFASLQSIGGIIGTCVSAFFLVAIAVANTIILISVYRTFRHVKNGGAYIDEDLNLILAKRGFFGRIFRSIFRLIQHSWQMYPLGLLFGLGFDTATEVGLLGISATAAAKGLSIWSILVFPALFTAGMALVDSTDSILMLSAYGWAFVKPIRKLYYNMTITFVSVIVALIIGGIEALGLIRDRLSLKGASWDAIGSLNENFSTIGFVIIGVFVASWAASLLIYRLKRYDEIEVPTGSRL
jgi:high-affinity nickel-transport protein